MKRRVVQFSCGERDLLFAVAVHVTDRPRGGDIPQITRLQHARYGELAAANGGAVPLTPAEFDALQGGDADRLADLASSPRSNLHPLLCWALREQPGADRPGRESCEAEEDRTRVLCVDDHEDSAYSAALLLQKMGFEAMACHNGADALAAADMFCPDVCLIDLAMPGMDGDELAVQLRQRARGRPPRCIALTGSWDIEAQHRTHNAGFEEHLVKPVEPSRLVAAVRGEGG